MTDASEAPVPAGWYTDPASNRMRWWDGASWTEHYSAATIAPSTVAPEGTGPYTPFIWAIVALPLVSLIALLTFDVSRYTVQSLAVATLGAPPHLDGGYALLSAVGWAVYLVTALLAFFDARRLRAAGVPKPFPWAWAFVGSLVYVIGRSIVVRMRTGRGSAPMIASIAIALLTLVVALTKVVAALDAVMRMAPYLR